MQTEKAKVDEKGRISIPLSFRKSLGIKKSEELVAELDKENERIILFPIEKNVKKLRITISDAPGALAKVAHIIAKNKADLIYSESRSVKRRKEAVWEVVADFSKTDLKKLKEELGKEKLVKKAVFC